MRQTRAIQIAFVIDENLGLVDQATKGSGMNDPISITLKFTAHGRRRLRVAATARGRIGSRVGRQWRIRRHRLSISADKCITSKAIDPSVFAVSAFGSAEMIAQGIF
jgi:hypothetical protein